MTRPFTLAVFTKNRVNPAYAAARLAADRVAAEAGARTMHFVPETPDDVGQQKALVGEALAAVPDAVVFVPVDDRQMVPDLARFAAAGIPVVTCINRMEGKVVSFVGSDDVAVGHTAAKALIDGLGGDGPHRRHRGHAGGADQPRPRPSACARPWPRRRRYELLGSGVGYFQQAPARAEMARLLAEHARDRRRLDRRTTSWRSARWRRWRRPAGRAKVVGVNGLPEAIDNIERGTMQASVDFSAFNIAGIAAHAALRHLRGEAVPASIMVPAALIDRTNFQRWKVPFALRPTPVWEEIVA